MEISSLPDRDLASQSSNPVLHVIVPVISNRHSRGAVAHRSDVGVVRRRLNRSDAIIEGVPLNDSTRSRFESDAPGAPFETVIENADVRSKVDLDGLVPRILAWSGAKDRVLHRDVAGTRRADRDQVFTGMALNSVESHVSGPLSGAAVALS